MDRELVMLAMLVMLVVLVAREECTHGAALGGDVFHAGNIAQIVSTGDALGRYGGTCTQTGGRACIVAVAMARIALIYAHPYPNRSRAGRSLLASVSNLSDVKVRSLYERYPDFAIDVAAEQALISEAELIVWQHPVFWYGPPPLMSLWFEKVLARGWAYGKGGEALRGKACLWVPTTGGDDNAYREGGMHGHSFDKFVPPVEQTARFCGMTWQSPLILHGAHHTTDDELHTLGLEYRERLRTFPTSAPISASATVGAST